MHKLLLKKTSIIIKTLMKEIKGSRPIKDPSTGEDIIDSFTNLPLTELYVITPPLATEEEISIVDLEEE